MLKHLFRGNKVKDLIGTKFIKVTMNLDICLMRENVRVKRFWI